MHSTDFKGASWDDLQCGHPVAFQIGFSFSGPLTLEAHQVWDRTRHDSFTTAVLEKGEPFRESSPQHSVSTTGLAPCASQPVGPSSLKTALKKPRLVP